MVMTIAALTMKGRRKAYLNTTPEGGFIVKMVGKFAGSLI